MTEPTGIDVARVTEWIVANVGAVAPLSFAAFDNGASNLTYAVTDSTGAKMVLRRPPVSHVLASAHDMAREYRVISALGSTEVPVPATLGVCTDSAVNDGDFYVMDFVEGAVVFNRADGESVEFEVRPQMTSSLVGALAALHAVDPDAVGLSDLGRRDGYCERQLRRWKRQIDEGSDRDLGLVGELYERLVGSVPAQQGVGIVHGDYRMDNCIMCAGGQVAAVLDWELCTLGDVLSDLAGLVMWWGSHPAEITRMWDVPTAVEGFGTAGDVLELYGGLSGRDLSELDWYLAFQHWRLACIIEGVRVRHTAGAMGETDYDEAEARLFVDYLLGRCGELLG